MSDGDTLGLLRYAIQECAMLRAELDRIRDLTGQVKHTNIEECAGCGCGCMSLIAEEAVIYALREIQHELAEQKRLNVQLAERLQACSECLGRAAERGKVCKCKLTPTNNEYTVANT